MQFRAFSPWLTYVSYFIAFSGLEDLGMSVTQHNDAIERNASRILSLGSNMEHVSSLRSGVTELNERVGNMLKDFEDKVIIPASGLLLSL